jgi:hypothetical protein
MKELQQKMQQQLNRMAATGKLFRSKLSGQTVWEAYIKAFVKDPIFRDPNSSEHNCNLCNNFIRRYGNIVAVVDGEIESIWDVRIEGEYKPVVNILSIILKSNPIQEVFFETYVELNGLNYEKCSKSATSFRLGIDKNHKRYTREEADKFPNVVQPNEIRTFVHLHLDIPAAFVDQSGKSVESIMGDYRSNKEVFERGIKEISLDTLELVRDLINQGSLLDGATHLYKIEQFIVFKKQHIALCEYKTQADADSWFWTASYNLPIGKFRNELIGVLCVELSEGMELNKAVQNWNKRVDPINYMKATAPITKRQIEEAREFVEENGYVESFNRRFANIDDIKVSEILHANIGDGKLKGVSLFDSIKSTSTRHKRSEFDKIEEVSIDKFMKDILPTCSHIEAFLTSQQEGNMVSLTTAFNPESKPIFKWSNNYSWTYNGNLAGKSQIKENVKSAGGKITGAIRASLQWNDEDTPGTVDFDFHCTEKVGTRRNEIYYGQKKSYITDGWLDVDMINPAKIGIENITWQNIPSDGTYLLYVKNFNSRPNKGFKIEIEFEGQVFNYFYQNTLMGDLNIATITVKDRVISIKHHLAVSEGLGAQKDIYGLPTNEFHKVNLVCLSPNHWGDNNVGNKHYFFMLDGAKSPISIRSFHNENLIPELAAHRKVLEVLGAQTMIDPSQKQLSGLGFNATVKDELILKLSGNFKRVIKIKF